MVVRSGWWVCAALLVAGQAWGQSDGTRAAARDLAADGVEDFQAGNYGPASEKLNRAFDILRAPSLGLWSARALTKNGKLVEASERYLMVSRLDASNGDVAVQKQAQADAASEREALQPRIPALTLSVTGATGSVSVTLDGAAVPTALLGVKQPTNPGKHQAEARQGGLVVRGEVTLAEGEREVLTLDFARALAVPGAPAAAPAAPANQPARPDEPTAADTGSRGVPAGVWVGVALTGAGLATGGITAGLAASKKSELDCPDGHCQPSQSDDVDAHNQLLTISTVGFIAAGVGVATAGVFWFTRPKAAEQTAYISPWVGVGSAGVLGAF